MKYEIYSPDSGSTNRFAFENLSYVFPSINTSRGNVFIGVQFLDTSVLQKVLQIKTNILSGFRASLGNTGSHSAAIPIPRQKEIVDTNTRNSVQGSPADDYNKRQQHQIPHHHSRSLDSRNSEDIMKAYGNFQQYSEKERGEKTIIDHRRQSLSSSSAKMNNSNINQPIQSFSLPADKTINNYVVSIKHN
jgi:hypothetical protein